MGCPQYFSDGLVGVRARHPRSSSVPTPSTCKKHLPHRMGARPAAPRQSPSRWASSALRFPRRNPAIIIPQHLLPTPNTPSIAYTNSYRSHFARRRGLSQITVFSMVTVTLLVALHPHPPRRGAAVICPQGQSTAMDFATRTHPYSLETLHG